jgi:hypothetical protein
MSTRTLAFFALLAASIPAVQAATLRVPEDFSSIQRAIFAASPNDTIAVAAGTYHEHLIIGIPLTIKGAGVGKTRLVGPDRSDMIVNVFSYGPVTLADLTVAHTAPTEREVPPASQAIAASFADLKLHNIELAHASGYGIDCKNNSVVIENVSVSNAVAHALTLTSVRARVNGLTVDKSVDAPALYLDRVTGNFQNLRLPSTERPAIQVLSGTSNVRFEGFSADQLAKIEWAQGASPDGLNKDYVPDVVETTQAEEAEQARALNKEQQAASMAAYAARAKLTRAFQTKLAAAANAEAAGEALADYFKELYANGEQGEDALFWAVPVNSELRSFEARYGTGALDTVLSRLPPPDPNSGPANQQYEGYLPQDIAASLSVHRAKTSVAQNLDLPKVLASWKEADGAKDPSGAANQFYEMAKAVSSHAERASAEGKRQLKAAVLEQVTPFIEKQGYAALDTLLNRLGQAPLAALSADDVRTHLTPQQKRALTKHLLQ